MEKVYYSKDLNKYFTDEEECLLAEKEYTEKHEAELKARAKRQEEAKMVEDLYKQANEKLNEANKAMRDFVNKYGSFHMSYTNDNVPENLFESFFYRFF